MTPTPVDGPARSQGLGLNDVLNILWRRRFLIVSLTVLGAVAGVVYGWVVTPLHLSTTMVQPGITHFAQGQPVREWRIKDVVQWYKRGDYNPNLALALGEDPVAFRPIIRASFIPRGPQSRGGNTITLTTLFPDPEKGNQILRTSVRVFNTFAGSDTAHSDIHLTRVSIETNIATQQEKIRQMAAKRENLELDIRKLQDERNKTSKSIALVEANIAELRASRNLVELTRQAYEEMLDSLSEDVDDMRSRLARWEHAEEEWSARRDSLASLAADEGPIEALLFANSLGTIVRELGELRLGLFEESARTLRWKDRIQALEREVKKIEREIQEREFERDQTIPSKILEIEQKIASLELRRDYDLVAEENEQRQELRTMRSRLTSLTPLEQVGDAVGSARPVRPRKRRAIQILTVLGLASSIFLAFTLEYLSKHWREITRPSPSA